MAFIVTIINSLETNDFISKFTTHFGEFVVVKPNFELYLTGNVFFIELAI